jgi:hypothetical protein
VDVGWLAGAGRCIAWLACADEMTGGANT